MSVINHIQTGRRYQRCDGQKPQIINKIRQLKQQQANAKQLKLAQDFYAFVSLPPCIKTVSHISPALQDVHFSGFYPVHVKEAIQSV